MTNKEKSAIQKEILDITPENPYGRWILAPRIGKTKLGIDLIKREKPKSILWVTPSAELAETRLPEEFVTWKAKKYLKSLTTSTWMSLDKVEGEFDLIILDEEQFATINNLQSIINGFIKGKSLISMTGTQSTHEHKQELYRLLKLPIYCNLNINDAVDLGLLSDYKITVLNVEMSKVQNIEAGNVKNRFMTSEFANYKYLSKTILQTFGKQRTFKILNRMRFIKNSQTKTEAAKKLLNELEGRKLIFCGSIPQSELLSKHTYNNKTDNKDLISFMKGDIKELAMVNKGGVGETYKEVDHLILIQADSDKTGLSSQKICRTLLAQKNYKANVWVICLEGTQDEVWVESTLKNFEESKIEYIQFKDINNHFNLNGGLDMFKKYGAESIQKGKNNFKI